ncbi:MAG: YlbF family regulator [Chloroflexota bacterium]|nr:MAG: YlbF family regulator [Chloroflexota bacterium]
METNDVKITKDLQEAVSALAVNLGQSEPFAAYRQAIQALEADPRAGDLLRRLAQAQTAMRTRQSQSGIPQADIDALRHLQREAQANETILSFSESQQAAIAYIREINQEISQMLGVDFGALARRSCC